MAKRTPYLRKDRVEQTAVKHVKQPAPILSHAERHWWVGEDAEREMRAYFPRDAVDVVLSVLRDGQEWGDALRQTDRGIAEVKVMMRQMRRHCKAIIRQRAGV